MIRAFTMRGYRCFRDPERVELRPLTLVYGENNSGKSALMRLLPWLASSREVGVPGFATQASVLRGAGWPDVVWHGGASMAAGVDDIELDIDLGLELESGDQWRWGGRWRDNWRTSVIEVVELHHQGTPVRAQLAPQREDAGSARVYAIGRRKIALPLDGIVPRPGIFPTEAVEALHSALGAVTWLSARRVGPTREGLPRGARGRVHDEGAESGALLLADPALLGRVSAWFERHLGRRVGVASLGGNMERLVLSGTGHDTPFPDVGEGLQRAFSVVVALEELRSRGGLLLVEEPESNLHPRLQRALAELASEILAARPQARVVFETHSEVFLLAAYRAAARGPEGSVAIRWVEVGEEGAGRVIPVELDPDGRPRTDRMERAFETMGALRREVIAARGAR